MNKKKCIHHVIEYDVLNLDHSEEIIKLNKIIEIRSNRLLRVTSAYNEAAQIVKDAKENANVIQQKMKEAEVRCKHERYLLDENYIGKNILPKSFKKWLSKDGNLNKEAMFQINEYEKAIESLASKQEIKDNIRQDYIAATVSIEKLKIYKKELEACKEEA